MDARSDPLSEDTAARGDGEPEPRRIESEVRQLRGELDGLVGELDRRRRRMLDWRRQLREHGRATTALVGCAAMAGGVLLARARRRRRNPWVRLQNLAGALAEHSRHPYDSRGTQRGGLGIALAGALGSAALAVARNAAARALVQRTRRR